MPTTSHDPFSRFFAAKSTNAGSKLVGVTVAQAGVEAAGHVVMLNKDGIVTDDPSRAVKTLPMQMDDESIQTALAAAKTEGRVRVRSDHADTLSARAGFADNFRIAGDKLVCDITLFDSYADRGVVLEAAKKTPELIGLSMDFQFHIQIKGGAAFVRVKALNAVDIVDEGAVTPGGLFGSKR